MGKSVGGGISFPNSFNDVMLLNQLQQDNLRRAADLTARYNFFDRLTPFGSQRFEGTPGTEGFRSIQELPADEQAYLDQFRQMRLGLQDLGMQQLQGAQGLLSQPIGGPGAFADSAADVERATFERGRDLLAPTFAQERNRLQNDLLQRGLPRSGEAFTEEQDRLADRQNQALENLALSSVGAGRQEQSRLLQSELARRAGMLQELSALGLGSQQMPQFQATPNIGVGASNINDPLALATQVQQGDLNRRNAMRQAGKGGAMGLANTALMGGMLAFGGGKGGGKGGGGGVQLGSQFNPFSTVWT